MYTNSYKLVKYHLNIIIIVVVVIDGNLKQNRNGQIERRILNFHSTTDLWIVRNIFWVDSGSCVIHRPQGLQQATRLQGKTQ